MRLFDVQWNASGIRLIAVKDAELVILPEASGATG
jgi:hypothetical protein